MKFTFLFVLVFLFSCSGPITGEKRVYICGDRTCENNKEVKELDPLTYQELKGTKEMIIERLAIVLANAMQYEKREAECFAKHQAWKESLNG